MADISTPPALPLLSREALLAAATTALPRERLDLPELGGAVYVQGMSGKQRDAWERSLVVLRRGQRRDLNIDNVRARLAVRCLVTEAGERILTDTDAPLIGNLRVDLLNRIYELAQKLSGVSDEDLDELGKSSAPADGSASPTSSPSS